MEMAEIENDILQILYLSKGQWLPSGKIARLLPKHTASKQLVSLLLKQMEKESLIETAEENKTITVTTPGTAPNVMKISSRNTERGKTFSAEKEHGGPANQWDITHTVYRITEKGTDRLNQSGLKLPL